MNPADLQLIRDRKGMELASYLIAPGTLTMPPDLVWQLYKSGQATMTQEFLPDGVVRVTFKHSGEPPIEPDRVAFRWSREGNIFHAWTYEVAREEMSLWPRNTR